MFECLESNLKWIFSGIGVEFIMAILNIFISNIQKINTTAFLSFKRKDFDPEILDLIYDTKKIAGTKEKDDAFISIIKYALKKNLLHESVYLAKKINDIHIKEHELEKIALKAILKLNDYDAASNIAKFIKNKIKRNKLLKKIIKHRTIAFNSKYNKK